MQELIKKMTNHLENGKIFVLTWTVYSLIEYVLSYLNIFMTECN